MSLSRALLQVTASLTPQLNTLAESAVKYGFTALLSWFGATLRFDGKMKKLESDLAGQMRQNQQQTNERLDSLEKTVASIGAEVWGPRGESGLRKDVSILQEDIRAQGETLAKILAILQVMQESPNNRRAP